MARGWSRADSYALLCQAKLIQMARLDAGVILNINTAKR